VIASKTQNKFQTQLAAFPKTGLYVPSCLSIEADTIAEKVIQAPIPGEWLTVYMLRRFGWPNLGSDDYKDLMRWMVTTPMPGLYVAVRPYLGKNSSKQSLHFTTFATKPLATKLGVDPVRDAYWKAREKAMRQWWEKTGRHLYTIGIGVSPARTRLTLPLMGRRSFLLCPLAPFRCYRRVKLNLLRNIK